MAKKQKLVVFLVPKTTDAGVLAEEFKNSRAKYDARLVFKISQPEALVADISAVEKSGHGVVGIVAQSALPNREHIACPIIDHHAKSRELASEWHRSVQELTVEWAVRYLELALRR